MVGYEVEVFTLDSEGKLTDGVDTLIKDYNKCICNFQIKKECSKSLLEISAFPKIYVYNAAMGFLKNLEMILECAEKKDLFIYPNATYPGDNLVNMRNELRYKVQENIIGKKRFGLAGKCAGFHFHYSMPRGVFDYRKNQLRHLINSKLKQSLIHSYNMAIAMDPAITCLLQSSPFIDRKYLGKDSRLVIYRGGKPFGDEGVYSEHRKLGTLSSYRTTVADLISDINHTHKYWIDLILESKYPEAIKEYPNPLMSYWGPVRLNRLGTLEQRGMDTTHPRYMIAVSILMKYIFKDIHREFYKVVPSDIGIDEPFKLEGNKIYIPPISRVKYKLQKESAIDGFDSPDVYEYCNRFIKLGKKCMNPKYKKVVSPLLNMFKKKRTVSDSIIKRVKKKGYSLEEKLPSEYCPELALKSCSTLLNEIEKTQKQVEDLTDD